MRAYVAALRVSKDGNAPDECEDAVGWWPGDGYDTEAVGHVLGVVSDGASESLLARHWARYLCVSALDLMVQAPDLVRQPETFAGMAVRAAHGWQDWRTAHMAARAADGRPVQWYEEPGLARGDHATVLAVHVDLGNTVSAGAKEGRWSAAALGDSCLFHVRGGQLLAAFPVTSSAAFDTSPALLANMNPDAAAVARHTAVAQGTCEGGDDLYLATDALAAWFLGRYERGGNPDEELNELTACPPAERTSAAWVARRRADGSMRNDDVGLLHISLA